MNPRPPRRLHIIAVALGSYGDVHPLLGISTALAARGHDVEFVANPLYREMVEEAGLRFVPLGQEEDFRRIVDDRRMWKPQYAARVLSDTLILPYMRPVYELIARRPRGPETVVIALVTAFGARLAQEKLGVKLATCLLQPALIPSEYDTPAVPLLRSGSSQWRRSMRRTLFWFADTQMFDRVLSPEVGAFRRELGLPPAKNLIARWSRSPALELGLFPEWYAQPQADWPPAVRCAGFPLFDESGRQDLPPELEAFLDDGEPPVVFTPGTANAHAERFFQCAAEACRVLGRRGLLLSHFPQQLPHALPKGVIRADYAPFSRLLPRAACLVYHGGIGTAAQAMRAGIPHLIVPFSYDQPDNAARLQRLGVARTIFPWLLTPRRMAAKLAGLLASPAAASACGEVREKIRVDDGPRRACGFIEELGAAP